MGCNYQVDDISMYLKLIILLYADDTVIFSDSETGLKHALNNITEYCAKWKLQVNTAKTKIVIFHSRGNISNKFRFLFGLNEIEIIKGYKYLGIYFSQSGSFAQTKITSLNKQEKQYLLY